MTLIRRVISLQITLGQGDFGQPSQDTVTVEGSRASVSIVHAGLVASTAQVQIWGLSPDLINRLTVTGKFYMEQKLPNRVTILAGDEHGQAVCFCGNILEAWGDASQAPGLMFYLSAVSGLFDGARPIQPTSFRGGVDVGTAISSIATQIGYGFENSGVTGVLTNPYKPGSAKAQVESFCRDVGCEFSFDDVAQVIAIWPKNGVRDGAALKLTPSTGLVGYPAFSQQGLRLRTIYNPSLRFASKIEIESRLSQANGTWKVAALAHRLESGIPDGQWFSDIETTWLDYAGAATSQA